MKRLKRQTPREESTTTREHPKGSLRAFPLNEGLPNLTVLQEEFQDYWDVLLGRVDPPVKVRGRTLALMEVADAYFARASEVKALIHRLEREGRVLRGSPLYAYRTGELADFMEMAKRAADLGSRRLTEAGQQAEAEERGREYR